MVLSFFILSVILLIHIFKTNNMHNHMVEYFLHYAFGSLMGMFIYLVKMSVDRLYIWDSLSIVLNS